VTRWTIHGERPIYQSDWVSIGLADVELPDGTRFEHHVVRGGMAAAGVAVTDPDRGILLLWRHRFIPDTWGWEIPAGRLDEGESPEEAAAREVLEETGWRPGPLTPLTAFTPMSGVADKVFHLFLAQGAEHVGDPVDVHESDRVEWVPVSEVRELIQRGEMPDGLSLVAVLWLLAFGGARIGP
jgi:8-oxo-dGTP pyrophosphatase MutT (NUDIX family)